MDKLALHTLLFRITQLQKAHLRPRMRSCDLTQGQPKVLHYLAKHAPCRQIEIARSCNIEAATTSKLLDNMEAKGLICREAVPSDKRAVAVVMSEQGKQAFMKWQSRYREVEQIACRGFDESEKALLWNLLERVYENLQEAAVEEDAHA